MQQAFTAASRNGQSSIEEDICKITINAYTTQTRNLTKYVQEIIINLYSSNIMNPQGPKLTQVGQFLIDNYINSYMLLKKLIHHIVQIILISIKYFTTH